LIVVKRVERVDPYLSPISESWKFVEQKTVKLQPVPLKAVTTSKYIRETLDEKKFGKVGEVRVCAVADESSIAIRVEWDDASRDDAVRSYRDFVDACAVMFPMNAAASVMTMGSEEAPVNSWLWRADGRVYDIISRGLGTTQRRSPEKSGLGCKWIHDGRGWVVVFSRKLEADGVEFVDLKPPKDTGVAFAVWEGSNRERGPLKAYSVDFMSLLLR